MHKVNEKKYFLNFQFILFQHFILSLYLTVSFASRMETKNV